MEAFLPSEKGRLIYGYLLKECGKNLADEFLNSSHVMDECRTVKKEYAREFDHTVQNLTLEDLLDQYSVLCSLIFQQTKDKRIYKNVVGILENNLIPTFCSNVGKDDPNGNSFEYHDQNKDLWDWIEEIDTTVNSKLDEYLVDKADGSLSSGYFGSNSSWGSNSLFDSFEIELTPNTTSCKAKQNSNYDVKASLKEEGKRKMTSRKRKLGEVVDESKENSKKLKLVSSEINAMLKPNSRPRKKEITKMKGL